MEQEGVAGRSELKGVGDNWVFRFLTSVFMDSVYLALQKLSTVGNTKINSMRCKKKLVICCQAGQLLALFQNQRGIISALPVFNSYFFPPLENSGHRNLGLLFILQIINTF